jgi:integration host factor subunit alpha
MTLTKVHIIESIIDELGLSRKKSTEVIETLIELLKSTLEKNEDVLISGFGKFCVNQKKARKGRNPATGKEMMLEKRRVVSFKCSQVLRKKINGV